MGKTVIERKFWSPKITMGLDRASLQLSRSAYSACIVCRGGVISPLDAVLVEGFSLSRGGLGESAMRSICDRADMPGLQRFRGGEMVPISMGGSGEANGSRLSGNSIFAGVAGSEANPRLEGSLGAEYGRMSAVPRVAWVRIGRTAFPAVAGVCPTTCTTGIVTELSGSPLVKTGAARVLSGVSGRPCGIMRSVSEPGALFMDLWRGAAGVEW